MTISELLAVTDSKVIERGKRYYIDGNISNITKLKNNTYRAKVEGEYASYNVLVSLDNTAVTGFSCDCPYDQGDVCKHLVAVFMALEDGQFKPGTPGTDLGKILESVSREELIGFIIEKADFNEQLKNDLLMTFGNFDREGGIAMVKDYIRKTVRENTYRGFIDYSGCNNICRSLSELIQKTVLRLSGKNCLSAFDISLELLKTGMKLASTADSSSGALTDIMQDTQDLLIMTCDEISRSCPDKDKDKCFDTMTALSKNKIFYGWSEWKYDLLSVAVKFLTEKNRKKFFDTLDSFLKENTGDFSGKFDTERNKIVRYYAIEKLDGYAAAYTYLLENIEVDALRKILINLSIEQEDYAQAEKWCLEKIDPAQGFRSCHEWLELMFEIYERWENREKQIEVARIFLSYGNTSHYEKFKKLCMVKGIWETEYRAMLAKMKGSYFHVYMRILYDEKEWELLFGEVKDHPSYVFEYGKYLASFGGPLFDIYTSQLAEKVAGAFQKRSDYKLLCKSINELYDLGGTDHALSLISDFKAKYKNRPAMLDELNKLTQKLTRSPK